MEEGRYPRRRRRKKSAIIWQRIVVLAAMVALLAGIVFLITLLFQSCSAPEPTEPSQSLTEPVTTEPTKPEPTETKPEPTETTPAPTQTDPAPTETEPAETQPAQTDPAETVPKETWQEETEPEPTEAWPEGTDTPAGDVGERIAQVAKSVVGSPYKWGGTTPSGFDTSGLVYYCLKQGGVNAPRAFTQQLTGGKKVKKADLQPGDVLFFDLDEDGDADYPAIYIGEGKLVAASSSRNIVNEKNFKGYFEGIFVTARRFS